MSKPKPRSSPSTSADSGDRRSKLASFEVERKRDQRRRTIGLFVICGVLALALLSYPLYLFVNDTRARSATLPDIGVSAADAGCDPAAEDAATGNQQHVAEGTKVPYAQTPPGSGAHYASPAPFTKRFYTMEDRPAVENLVHNLEHGYTIAWYRDSMAADQSALLEQLSKTFAGDDYTKDKFIAAPWSVADGNGFPEGKNVVLAHWSADAANPTDTSLQKGVRQACATVSGEAIQDFMTQYPYTASPEPNGA